MSHTVPLLNPAARHPFRQRHVRPGPVRVLHDDDRDLKLFVLSFTAFFICFYTLIA